MLKNVLIMVLLGVGVKSYAQLPSGWTVNPPSYNYSMTLTGYILDSCIELSNNNNAVAAFVGGQCRGVTYTNQNGNGHKLAFLTIYSNQVSGEAVELRFFNSTTSTEKICLDGVTFQSNGVVGSVGNPFVLTTNHSPFNLQLSNHVVQESTQPGGFIGNFSAQDIDTWQTLTFNFVGTGLDNNDFLISGTQLQLNTILNYAIKDTYAILVEVHDGYSCRIQDTFLILVDDNAFPPIAENDTVSVLEDETLEVFVLLNDTDYDNDLDSSSVLILTPPTQGIATVDSTGKVTYVPNANYFGMDSLQYQVSDLTNTGPMSDSAWVIITVVPVPDPPVAVNDTAVTDEEVAVDIFVLANDTDVENDIDPSSVQVISGPYHGTITIVNGVITYTSDLDYFGLDSMVYVVCDSTSPSPLCDTAMVFLTVNQVPDAPVDISVDSLFIDEDNDPFFTFATITTTDVDLPDDAFSYSLVPGTNDSDNHHFQIDGNKLVIRSKTNYEIKQVYHLRLQTTDDYGLTYQKAFNVTIRDIIGNNIPLPIATYISNNGDGKNDFLTIQDVDIYDYFHLSIFDQFGHVVYNVDQDYNNDWDGTMNGEKLPSGAYYYWFRSETKEYKGNITIVN